MRQWHVFGLGLGSCSAHCRDQIVLVAGRNLLVEKCVVFTDFRFDGYVRDRTTSEVFITPSSTVTNGLGGAWEYRRVQPREQRRLVWARWLEAVGIGCRDASNLVKYSAGLSRDFYLNPFQKLHFTERSSVDAT